MWVDDRMIEAFGNGRDAPVDDLESAIDAFRSGKPVLIHDASDREDEIDLVYPAQAVTPSAVARLRNDAGGLLCVALGHGIADAFDLPFVGDIVDHPASRETAIEYDDRSSFSLTVNHRETYTGVTDIDRARTISALGEAARDPSRTDFAAEFDVPGHVHVLRAAPNLLDDRQGHTEFGVALADLAELPLAVVVCEMLDDQTGGALTRSRAVTYARDNNLPFLDGSTIDDAAGNR